MLNILFFILMLIVFGKLLVFAIGATWGIARIFFSIILLPFILVMLLLKGLVVIAFPILVLVGIISLFTTAKY